MKRFLPVLLILACVSLVSGLLLSRASLVGRVGISLFYRKYSFLKTWWQGAVTVFVVLILFLIIQGFIQYKLPVARSRLIHYILILAALAGLVFTYLNFRHSTTHRWLGERFHIGAYLFWLGWIVISIFYLMLPAKGFVITNRPAWKNNPLL